MYKYTAGSPGQETTVEIQFRHSRERSWTKKFGFRAITTAVGVITMPNKDSVGCHIASAIECVVCSPEDNFSRAEGRRRATIKLITRAKMIVPEVRTALLRTVFGDVEAK